MNNQVEGCSLMENILIREALLTDIPKLLEFEQGVISAERPFDETLKEGNINYYDLDKLINQADSQVIVAEIAGELVGSGYALIKESKEYIKHERYSYFGFMYVDPSHRRKGVNQLIVETLKNWSKNKGVYNISLGVFAGNQSAINAYEKAGFSKTLIEMRLQLEK